MPMQAQVKSIQRGRRPGHSSPASFSTLSFNHNQGPPGFAILVFAPAAMATAFQGSGHVVGEGTATVLIANNGAPGQSGNLRFL